ncbi:trichohyalin-like protein 1 [Sarcophilus harrisii]|uniref:Trichohyalin like 1 n=1 Tax=Sarcophilus harrisii TaxID=9305 RepID=G3WVS1_SARHA|nr:trichohyalin-like protein 1 [Sarcophilus harrisii]
MPQLLQSVIYIIETFQNYAREEDDCSTLSLGQLRQLLLREIGEFLKPFDTLTTESSLNVLDREDNETISFNEFLLLVFDLLNICYRDIQSFLNLESKAKSDIEEELSGGMETCETNEDYQEEAELDQDKQRLTDSESPSLVNPIENVPDTLSKEDSQDDLENPRLLEREIERDYTKNKYQSEGDHQSQERGQVQARGGDGVSLEEKELPKEFVKRTCSQKDEKIVSEEHEVPRQQDDANTGDQPSEQEGEQNVEILSEQRAQTTSESQEGAIIKDAEEHTETQKPSSQENQEKESETADLPTEKAEEKLSDTKRLSEFSDDDRTPDIQEPLEQEREYETQDIVVKGNNSRVPEIEVLIDERKGKRKLKNLETVGKKENEKGNQMEIFTEQESDGKEKQLEGLAEEGDIRKDSETPDSKADNQNHPECKGPAASEEEVTVSKISEQEFSGDNRSASAAEKIPETKDRVQGSGPQDDQSGEGDEKITQTLDQSTEQYDGNKVQSQNDGTISETCNNPEEDESGSELKDLPAQRNCQSQVDAQELPDQEDGKNTQESPVLSDKSRTPETEVPIAREDENNAEEQLAEEKEKKSSVPKTPAMIEESVSQPASQESMKQNVIEITDPIDDEYKQLSIVQQSEKEYYGKDPEAHDPDTEEKGEESESQEVPLEGQDLEMQDLTMDSSSDTLNPMAKEDQSPQRQAGEVSEQQHVMNKEEDSLPRLSEQIDRKSRDTELCLSSGDEIDSKLVVENLQKISAQPDLPAPEQDVSQTDTSQACGTELRVERESQRSKTSEFPVLLHPLCDYRQEPRHQVEDPEPDEEYVNQQEILIYQSQEDDQIQQEEQQEIDGSSLKC